MKVEYDAKYTRYQAERGSLRRLVRRLYLNRAARLVDGPTLDFGCGVGELLQRLPAGSKGVEYNRDTVAFCSARGLDVSWYDGFSDDWNLGAVAKEDGLRSMILSHVLEHLKEPMSILGRLLAAAGRKGMERVVVIVPGRAGFSSDATHLTFVDLDMLRRETLRQPQWRVTKSAYFPFNHSRAGNYFVHNELQVVFQRVDVTY